MSPDRKNHANASVLLGKFALAGIFVCVTTNGIAATVATSSEAAPDSATPAYFKVAGRHVPSGKEIYFAAYNTLPKDRQEILEKSDDVKGYKGLSGKTLYPALDPRLGASLLNISAKLSDTYISNERSAVSEEAPEAKVTILSYMLDISEIRPDRIFFTTTSHLCYSLAADKSFVPVIKLDNILHPPVKDGKNVCNYKRVEPTGGDLQIVVSKNADGYRADVDIDKHCAQGILLSKEGIKHAFGEVVPHLMAHVLHISHFERTNPYDIFNILKNRQHIDPHYTIRPRERRQSSGDILIATNK